MELAAPLPVTYAVTGRGAAGGAAVDLLRADGFEELTAMVAAPCLPRCQATIVERGRAQHGSMRPRATRGRMSD